MKIPSGYCHCGCGGKTRVSGPADKIRVADMGKPNRFLTGHNSTAPVETRFWSKVEKTDNCWIWTGSKNPKGYGSFKSAKGTKAAHRMSWVLAFGEVPEGLQVLHKCDNPSCVRPEHLFIGTSQDNSSDMVIKGRSSHSTGHSGEKHSMAKLTAVQVAEIRSTATTETGVSVGRRMGISKCQVSKIRLNQAWCTT